jgi:hypothetical protein
MTPGARRPRTHLGQLVKVDHAQSAFPLPIGGGAWQWFRQTRQRLRLTARGRRELGPAQVVFAVDARGRPAGIAYGKDILTRIVTTGVTETIWTLRVVLDGTARRLGDGATDFDLLAAACLAAKDPARQDDPDAEPSS